MLGCNPILKGDADCSRPPGFCSCVCHGTSGSGVVGVEGGLARNQLPSGKVTKSELGGMTMLALNVVALKYCGEKREVLIKFSPAVAVVGKGSDSLRPLSNCWLVTEPPAD